MQGPRSKIGFLLPLVSDGHRHTTHVTGAPGVVVAGALGGQGLNRGVERRENNEGVARRCSPAARTDGGS
jgi:hypothetical protein